MSVAVEGTISGVDPDVTERAPGRVVIVMPDFTADAVAHLLSRLGGLADQFGSVQRRRWSFAAVVRARRRSLGLTQEGLAVRAGCDRQSIVHIENASPSP
jgi:hypothetical protein